MTSEGGALRAWIGRVLPTDSELDAFCLDYFPPTECMFTNGMDRIAKVSLLIKREGHEAIEAALRKCEEKGRDRAPAGPHNLQRRRPFFVGREEELAAIDLALRSKGQTTITQASLFGMGGVGKTALALEYAHRAVVRGTYPGGVWWLLAEGKPVTALVTLAPVLLKNAPAAVRARIPENETRADVIAEAVRLALQACSEATLLVLDNVSERDWRDHLPGGQVRVLVTTRDGRVGLGDPVPLGVLSPEDARALAIGVAKKDPEGDEAPALERVVVNELGGLAVAIEMAAHAVQRWFDGSWKAYERHLREEIGRLLGEEELFGDYGRGVFPAIDLSIDRAGSETAARRLLEGAAVFAPDAVPIAWALAAAGIEGGSLDARRGPAALRDLGIATTDEVKGVLSLHRLVHRRVRERAARDGEAAWRAARQRGAEEVARWLVAIVRYQQVDREEMEAVDARRAHVEAALRGADEAGSVRTWILIAGQLETHLQHRASYDDALALSRRALERAERLDPPDRGEVAVRLSNLAGVLQDLGRASEARPLLERALVISEETHDPQHPRVAIDLSNLATALKDLGQVSEARPLLERALAIDEKTYGAEHPRVAIRLSNLSMVLQDLGEASKARPLLERALAIGEEIHGAEHPIVAIRLSNLSGLLKDLGEVSEARPLLERALAIAEKTYGAEHPTVAIRLSKLATLLKDLGEASEALPLLKRALAIDEKTYGAEHPRVATQLSNLSMVLKDLGQVSEARLVLERAITIAKKVFPPGHPNHQALAENLRTFG